MPASATEHRVVQWLVDTRPLWPEAQKTRDLETHASRALTLLTPDERVKVLRYYHVGDAKMAIASAMLKRYAISRLGRVPWQHAGWHYNTRTKPVPTDPSAGPLDFNVSHQAGLVALAAVQGCPGADVGVDVVCTSERRARDHRIVRKSPEGWARFVDMHAEVMAEPEVARLKRLAGDGGGGGDDDDDSDDALDMRLRCFYALWCLREAYVKMTGDALLAEWLRRLEFLDFAPPAPAERFAVTAGTAGQVIGGQRIAFEGRPVTDANIRLEALGPNYMLCTAVRTTPDPAAGLALRLGPFEMLTLEEIMRFAEAGGR